MIVPRSIVVPVVVALVVVSAFVAWLPIVTLPSQFERWERHSRVENWAIVACGLRKVYLLGPAIPALFLAFGVQLVWPRGCRLSQLVWYACTAVIVNAVWALWTFVVLHSFYEFAQPL